MQVFCKFVDYLETANRRRRTAKKRPRPLPFSMISFVFQSKAARRRFFPARRRKSAVRA